MPQVRLRPCSPLPGFLGGTGGQEEKQQQGSDGEKAPPPRQQQQQQEVVAMVVGTKEDRVTLRLPPGTPVELFPTTRFHCRFDYNQADFRVLHHALASLPPHIG